MLGWNRILQKREYSLEIPEEIVADFASILEEKKAERVLDVGCGAGRHVIYLVERGFEPLGIDISKTGLNLTKERLRNRELEAEIAKCGMKYLPFIDSCFDAVICVQTIYHQKLKDIEATFSEVQGVLKKHGLFLTNFHSTKSSKYGKGVEVEENTFMQETGVERGVIHHFVDENEINELFRDFRIVSLEMKERMIDTYMKSRVNVIAEKI